MLLELTNRCNYNCPYCHIESQQHYDSRLSLDRLQRLAEELVMNQFHSLILSGGEPLLHRHFFEILQIMKNAALEVDFCTNGTLLNEKNVTRLREAMNKITVTMDTSDEKTFYEMKRVKGSYHKVLAGIELLLSYGFTVNITIVPTAKNIQHIRQTLLFLADLGVSSVTLLRLYEYSYAADFIPDRHQEQKLIQELPALESEMKKAGVGFKTKGFLFTEPNIGACRAGESIFGIDTAGYLLPCILIPKQEAAWNLVIHSLQEALASIEMSQFNQKKNCFDMQVCL